MRSAETGDAPPLRVVGVDDWAIRRGHEYGTILVDLERRAPIGAPEAVQVADWWHLLKNAGDAFDRVAQRHRAALQRAANDVGAEEATSADTTPPVATTEVGARTEK